MANNYLQNTISAMTGMYIANSLIDANARRMAERQNVLGHTYSWKEGNIFYTVKGQGKPLLLIHNLGHRSASYEWDDIVHHLSKDYKVYCIDLLGCGRSDKPRFTYTTYLYVQLLHDFVSDVVEGTPAVVSNLDSAPLTVMANKMYPELFSKIVLINPTPVRSGSTQTDQFKMAYMTLLTTPILGRTVYNMANLSRVALEKTPLNKRLSPNYLMHSHNAYIAAHLDNSRGRYLHASKINGYMQANYKPAIQTADNISLIISMGSTKSKRALKTYLSAHPKTKYIKLDTKSVFPHMDLPVKTLQAIRTLLK